MSAPLPHIPVLRFGQPYESLDTSDLADYRTGRPLAKLSIANPGLVRRDLRKVGTAAAALRALSCAKLIEICAKAGELFLKEALPLGAGGQTQSPDDYVEKLSATSGLPHNLCRANMLKVHQVFVEMPTVLKGLTRGLDLRALDDGLGEQSGVPVSYFAATDALGVVLPSNSPGVNSLWIPAIALKVPVILKPGGTEPWTPYRVIQALIAAGCPKEAFGFYPTDHEGASTILERCARGMIFGDDTTTERYRNNPAVSVHGAGRSKVVIGADQIEHWREHLDVLVESILANGGRSCVNASAVVVPKYGREIAQALAERLGPMDARAATDPQAQLSGFANPKMTEWLDETLEEGLREPGAEDVTARFRSGPRKVTFDGGHYMRPTVVFCESFAHPLANREFLFPYASVVEVPQAEVLATIGPSLVVTAITKDEAFVRQLLAAPHIDRLNIGPIPTPKVRWDQPHEGNLFEFLYARRAFQRVGA